MTIENLVFIKAFMLRETYGVTKDVKKLMLIYKTLKRARNEKSIEKFCEKENLINDKKRY